MKCNITGCSEYKHDSNTCICIKCDSTESERIRNGNKNNEYLSCYGQCTIGPLDKCKTCGDIIGECGTCNDGYILNSNKKCIPNFHLFANNHNENNDHKIQFFLLYQNDYCLKYIFHILNHLYYYIYCLNYIFLVLM